MNTKPTSWKEGTINAFGVIAAIVAFSLLPAGPMPVGNILFGTALWLGSTALFAFLAYRGITYKKR